MTHQTDACSSSSSGLNGFLLVLYFCGKLYSFLLGLLVVEDICPGQKSLIMVFREQWGIIAGIRIISPRLEQWWRSLWAVTWNTRCQYFNFFLLVTIYFGYLEQFECFFHRPTGPKVFKSMGKCQNLWAIGHQYGAMLSPAQCMLFGTNTWIQ